MDELLKNYQKELITNDLQEFYSRHRENIRSNLQDPKVNVRLDGSFIFKKKTEFVTFAGINNIMGFTSEYNHIIQTMKDIPRLKNIIYNFKSEEQKFEHIPDKSITQHYNEDDQGMILFTKDFNSTINRLFKNKIEIASDEEINTVTQLPKHTGSGSTIIRHPESKENIKEMTYTSGTPVNDKIKKLIYIMSSFHQAFYDMFRMLIMGSLLPFQTYLPVSNIPEFIIVLDNDLNSISIVCYVCVLTKNANFKFCKIIIYYDITVDIQDIGICNMIIELDFDYKNDSDNLQISHSSFRKTLLDYLIKINSISGNVNILPCLAIDSTRDGKTSMTGRELPGRVNAFKLAGRELTKDKTNFYIKDCTGDEGDVNSYENPNYISSSSASGTSGTSGDSDLSEDETPKTVVRRGFFRERRETKKKATIEKKQYSNICTYNGLLTYHKAQQVILIPIDPMNPMFKETEIKILNEIFILYSNFNNIACNLIITSNNQLISSLFSTGIITALDFILITHEKIILYRRSTSIYDYEEIQLFDLNQEELLGPLKERYDKLKIIHEIFKLKSYQNMYIIAEGKYTPNPELYDPPISLDGMSMFPLFLRKFSELYKIGLPILASSYFSSAILTSTIIYSYLILPSYQNIFENIEHIFKIFIYIYTIRNFMITMGIGGRTSDPSMILEIVVKSLEPIFVNKKLFDITIESMKSYFKMNIKFIYDPSIFLHGSTNKGDVDLSQLDIGPYYYNFRMKDYTDNEGNNFLFGISETNTSDDFVSVTRNNALRAEKGRFEEIKNSEYRYSIANSGSGNSLAGGYKLSKNKMIKKKTNKHKMTKNKMMKRKMTKNKMMKRKITKRK